MELANIFIVDLPDELVSGCLGAILQGCLPSWMQDGSFWLCYCQGDLTALCVLTRHEFVVVIPIEGHVLDGVMGHLHMRPMLLCHSSMRTTYWIMRLMAL